MISAVVLLLAQRSASDATIRENTPREIAYCSGNESGQPYRFCLADQRNERGKRELSSLLPKARIAALAQRTAIAQFSKKNGAPTLGGDPVTAFEKSQILWKRSADADCWAVGLSRATAFSSTEPVTTDLECEASRVFDRIEFLRRIYDIKD